MYPSRQDRTRDETHSSYTCLCGADPAREWSKVKVLRGRCLW